MSNSIKKIFLKQPKPKLKKGYDVEALRKVDFTRYINTPIKVVGGKRIALCPFHVENHASFVIYPDNSYHCFGCNAHGNAIDFLMKKCGYTFIGACGVLETI